MRTAARCITFALALIACDEDRPKTAQDAGEDREPGDNDASTAPPTKCTEYRVYELVMLTREQICDGLWACDPDQDEIDCPDVFRCELFQGHDVTFIHRDLVCDGFAHCTLADDEMDCPDRENLFCSSGDEGEVRVYTPEQACDGYNECYWAEDERDCPDSFLCPSNNSGPGAESIPRSKVCDGVWDCMTDEFDCPDADDPFICPGGRAIDRKFVCDQVEDCAQGSGVAADEADPSCHQFDCMPNSWRLGLGSARAKDPWFIDESAVCDGTTDCPDGLDERDCPPSPRRLSLSRRRSLSWVRLRKRTGRDRSNGRSRSRRCWRGQFRSDPRASCDNPQAWGYQIFRRSS